MRPTLKMRRLDDDALGGPGRAGMPLPEYQTAGAAGFDLAAALAEGEVVTLKPHEVALIHTGFAMQIPAGFEAQIRPRSGMALKHQIIPINSPGTIDIDYTGPVRIAAYNAGLEPFTITRGMRIAQMVICPVVTAIIEETTEAAPATARGAGGFGSTGA